MDLRDDFYRAVDPWLERPRQQLRRHVRACGRSFVPVEGNNDFRKLLGLGLFLLWATLTLAQAFGYGSISTTWYGLMTAIVYTIIGIQWGFELNNLPITMDANRTDGGDDDDGGQ